MRKRLLPLPLILLTPIVLLVIVVVAGVYRFSLDDDDILAKFSAQKQSQNRVMQEIFNITTPNPWTINVPETHAFALINTIDNHGQWAQGRYSSGSERGQVSVSIEWLLPIDEHKYLSLMTVSNQGSGVFYYLVSFKYDVNRQRMILANEQFIGDRIAIDDFNVKGSEMQLRYRQHRIEQAYSEAPSEAVTSRYRLNEALAFILLP